MPLVFVHGVANRPSAESAAEAAQRNALFKRIVLENDAATVLNPDWGSNAAHFSPSMPWLPDSERIQAYSAGTAEPGGMDLGLGRIARVDGAQAVDLAVLSALERAIAESAAREHPEAAASADVIDLAALSARYLDVSLPAADAEPTGRPELVASSDADFAEALEAELDLMRLGEVQGYGVFDTVRGAVAGLAGWVTNGVSDAGLRWKRRTMSASAALFLGDIFVYLRERDSQGEEGTSRRIFQPVLDALIAAAKAPRKEGEPLVVVGHSLGGVILYDLLTDPACLAHLETEAPGLRIDLLQTVGSQPGFFADLGLYKDKPRTAAGLLEKPRPVGTWFNVYDFTDVFSFLCAPLFEGVRDFGFDTRVDLVRAHSSYFRRPSFYGRMRARLRELGHG